MVPGDATLSARETEALRGLLVALEEGGRAAFENALRELAHGEAKAGAWVVLAAENLLGAARLRHELAPLLHATVDALDRAGHGHWAMRGMAVATQSDIADREYDAAGVWLERLEAAAESAAESTQGGALVPAEMRSLYRGTARLLRAQILMQRDDATMAASLLDDLASAAQRDPGLTDPGFLLALASLRVIAHSLVGRVELLERAVADLRILQGVDSPLAAYHLGVIAEARGARAEARSHFARVIATETVPVWAPAAHLALARLEPARAAEHLAAASAATDPDDPIMIAALARAELATGRVERACRLADRLAEMGAGLLAQVEIYIAAGPVGRAWECAMALRDHARDRGLLALEGQAHLFLAHLEPDVEARIRHLGMARAVAIETGDVLTMARVRVEQVWLELTVGDIEAAIRSAALVDAMATQQDRADLAALAALARGLALQAQADKHLQRAEDLALRHGLPAVGRRARDARGARRRDALDDRPPIFGHGTPGGEHE